MTETDLRPVLGSTEAAVRACVNLIALATHTDEDHLAYWLDLYYQTRCRHECRASTPTFHEFMEMLGSPSMASAPTEETVEAPQPAAPAAPLASSRGAMSEGGSPETPAAAKKNNVRL